MKKIFLFPLIILFLFIGSVGIQASDKIETLIFPVKITVDGKPTTMDNDTFVLNYNGHAYFPIKWLSNNLHNFLVSYNNMDKSININTNFIIAGPLVSPDKAKLVGFETYHVKQIKNITSRLLTDEELEQRPDDPKDITPIYYILEAVDSSNKDVIICVSTNKEEHNFILVK